MKSYERRCSLWLFVGTEKNADDLVSVLDVDLNAVMGADVLDDYAVVFDALVTGCNGCI